MKNKHIFIPLFVFLGAGLVSLIWSVIDFKGVNKQLSYSSETIQFNYDGSSDGVDPNGRTFDAINFMTDDVIEAAFQKSGLTGEKYSVDNVKQYIAIENVVPKDIVKEINSYDSVLNSDTATGKITTKDYHPVRYRFVVYQNLGVSQGELNKLVSNLVDEYVAKFTDVYTNKLNKESYNEMMDFDDYDYRYQTQVLSREINIIINYASELHARHNDFASGDQSFRDLIAYGNELNANLTYIDDLINTRSITKNPEELKIYYNYQLVQLNKDLDKVIKDLNEATTELDNYEKDKTTHVANGETIVTIGNNSAETYDGLLSRKSDLKDAKAKIEAKIAYITELRDRIDTVTQEEIDNIVSRINNIKARFESLQNDFTSLLAQYNAKYMGADVITKGKVTYQSSSLISSAFIVRCIKIGMPIMLITMLGISIYYLTRTIIKQKKAA